MANDNAARTRCCAVAFLHLVVHMVSVGADIFLQPMACAQASHVHGHDMPVMPACAVAAQGSRDKRP
eukprot:15450261-Alexandrium_andersonii.AAC.1